MLDKKKVEGTTYSSSTSDTRPHRTTISSYSTFDGNLQKGQTKRQMTIDFANITRNFTFNLPPLLTGK